MHLGRRDRVATVLVAAAVIAYLIWLAGNGPLDETDVRVMTGIVLALGFVASASAVVPGFDALLHGSKTYLVVSSLLGLGAFASGIAALVSGDESPLIVLMVLTVVLWVISTVRHSAAAGAEGRGSPVPG